MKIETVKRIIDGIEFNVQQFKWSKSIELEIEVIEVLSPALDVLKNFKNMDDEIEFNELGMAIQKAITTLRGKGAFEFISKLVCQTFATINGKETLLENENIINEVFHGQTMTAIKLVIEVMKINKFAFIAGLAGRDAITGIFTPDDKNKNKK